MKPGLPLWPLARAAGLLPGSDGLGMPRMHERVPFALLVRFAPIVALGGGLRVRFILPA